MKRVYGVTCEYSHNDETGKYQIAWCTAMNRYGYNMVLFNSYGEPHPYQYESIAEMTCDILTALKSNGYFCKWYRECSARWYDIWFMNSAEVGEWNRYGITEEYIQNYSSDKHVHISSIGQY